MGTTCRKRIKRAKKRNPDFQAVCFYTGLEVLETATTEHLISKSMTRWLSVKERSDLYTQSGSVVFASHSINNLIGNAPLAVKYRARAFLHQMTQNIFPRMNERQKAWAYNQYLRQFLSAYRIHIVSTKPGADGEELAMSVLPWDWKTIQVAEYREIVYNSFLKMLSPEERRLVEKQRAWDEERGSNGRKRKDRVGEDTDDVRLAIAASAA